MVDRIHALAVEQALPDPLVPSTDAYVTSICYIGSKSLSHVLSCIERCKDRLLAIGPVSPVARRQIITSVMQYWKDQPGIGVNIIDKLLNYTILSPQSVVQWAIGSEGKRLSQSFVYEMVEATVGKVTGRIRQVQLSLRVPGLLEEQKQLIEKTVEMERINMRELGREMDELLTAWANGSKDQEIEMDGREEDRALVRGWGERWLRVFRRKFAVEEAWGVEASRWVAAPEPEVEKVQEAVVGEVKNPEEMKIDADGADGAEYADYEGIN